MSMFVSVTESVPVSVSVSVPAFDCRIVCERAWCVCVLKTETESERIFRALLQVYEVLFSKLHVRVLISHEYTRVNTHTLSHTLSHTHTHTRTR